MEVESTNNKIKKIEEIEEIINEKYAEKYSSYLFYTDWSNPEKIVEIVELFKKITNNQYRIFARSLEILKNNKSNEYVYNITTQRQCKNDIHPASLSYILSLIKSSDKGSYLIDCLDTMALFTAQEKSSDGWNKVIKFLSEAQDVVNDKGGLQFLLVQRNTIPNKWITYLKRWSFPIYI